jgi:hypothetical protein
MADGKTKPPDAIGLGHLGNAKRVDQAAHPEGGEVIQVRQPTNEIINNQLFTKRFYFK